MYLQRRRVDSFWAFPVHRDTFPSRVWNESGSDTADLTNAKKKSFERCFFFCSGFIWSYLCLCWLLRAVRRVGGGVGILHHSWWECDAAAEVPQCDAGMSGNPLNNSSAAVMQWRQHQQILEENRDGCFIVASTSCPAGFLLYFKLKQLCHFQD